MLNPFNFGNPVPPQKMVGRSDQIEAVVNDLMNAGGHSHAVIGGRRFGKSSFLEALQHSLLKQLNGTTQGGWYVFPVMIDLKSLTNHSPQGVFSLVLNTLYTYFTSVRLKKMLGIHFDLDLEKTKLGSFILNQQSECSLHTFSAIMDEFLDVFGNSYGLLRLVFLIDEAEFVLNKDWTEILFSNLRSLIYDGFLRDYIRYVITGSSELIDLKENGSALMNMLKVTYLRALNEGSILQIIHWADDVSSDVANAVLKQSGGHPFITQYLMHHLWENSLSTATEASVLGLANQFISQRYPDLQQWQSAIGRAGQFAYKFLLDADDWLTEGQVRQQVNDASLKIGPGLIALCYHGLTIHDDTWTRYHCTGELWKNWFNSNIVPSFNSQASPLGKENNFLDNDPTITIQFKTLIFPTAYSYSLTSKSFPFLTCIVDNKGQNRTNARITAQVTIQGFSEPTTDTVVIASDSTQPEKMVLLPKLNPSTIPTLNDIRPAKCRILILRHVEAGSRVLWDKDYDINLHALDTALLAILTATGEIAEDLADYLSVFVTPHTAEIERLIRLAAGRLPDKAVIGYQGATDLIQARGISRSQARAFFDTLKKDAGLLYTNAPINYGKETDQVTQRVRPPIISLHQNKSQANCIDGAVLFASLLENAGMEPLIVLVLGHAFVGWRIWRESKECDFLETTMIGTKTFQAALNQGNKEYEEALEKNYDKRNLFHNDGFIRIVDVAACRKRGIIPLM